MEDFSEEDRQKADNAFADGQEIAETLGKVLRTLAELHGEYKEDFWEGFYDKL